MTDSIRALKDEPHIIRASSGADIVACAPTFVGLDEPPVQSLVTLFFVGKRTYGGMRVDLPARRRRSDLRSMSRQVAELALRVPEVDGVMFVLYCDETYEQERGIPWPDLARELMSAAERSGLQVKDGYCVAPDGWGCYDDPISSREPRPLSALDENGVAWEARVFSPDGMGRSEPSEQQSREFDAAFAFFTAPVGDDEDLDDDDEQYFAIDRRAWEDVGRAIEADADNDTDADVEADGSAAVVVGEGGLIADSSEPPTAEELVGIVERMLTPEIQHVTGVALCLLAFECQAPSRRDQTMLQIAFGEQMGRDVAASNAVWHERQREHGGSMDETVMAARDAGEDIFADESAGLIAGASLRAPDRERVRAGIRVLEAAYALAPYWMLSPLGCMLAWLHWSLGRGSVAHRYVLEVLDSDPDHGMGVLLFQLMSHRQFPDWLFMDSEGRPMVPPRAGATGSGSASGSTSASADADDREDPQHRAAS